MNANEWMPLLRAEADKTSIGQVAKRVGYSRATISLVLAGKYPGDLGKVGQAVKSKLGQLLCPWLGEQISTQACTDYACGPMPNHHPYKMKHWQHCQQCSNNPKGAQ